MLEPKTPAPDFTLRDQNETTHCLAEYRGTWVVIYFYPKDDTPGCTKEACGIAEVYDEFVTLGVTILGVSKDSPQSHAQFATKFNLPFTLLSDESTEMIQSYGAWGEKSLYGKNYLGTLRLSYLVDPKGIIAKVYPKVDPTSHALEIVADVKELMKKE